MDCNISISILILAKALTLSIAGTSDEKIEKPVNTLDPTGTDHR
jgi:hypothetical protein